MSLKSKVLMFTLAAALAAFAGLHLTSSNPKNAVHMMASAVWGS